MADISDTIICFCKGKFSSKFTFKMYLGLFNWFLLSLLAGTKFVPDQETFVRKSLSNLMYYWYKSMRQIPLLATGINFFSGVH